jgi:GNAT superfamily N-acetyltransferase
MPSMSGHIRRATPADWPRIWEIRLGVQENQLTNLDAVTDDDVAWFTEHPGIWLWEEAGKVLGFSAADTRDGSVWALFIDPAHQSRGIGRALFAKACEVLREAGHRAATLSTGPGTRAERFYRVAGWTAGELNAKGELVFRRIL